MVHLESFLYLVKTRYRKIDNRPCVHVWWWQWFSCSVVSSSCNARDCSPPRSSVHGISQVSILEWAAISFSRDIFPNQGSNWVSCITGRFLTNSATREANVQIHQDLCPQYDAAGNPRGSRASPGMVRDEAEKDIY